MALVKADEILGRAEREGYAVPAINAYNGETVVAVLRSARKLRSPVIIQAFDRLFSSDDQNVLHNARAVAALVKEFAWETPVPVALHVDHGSSYETVVKAMRWGYTSAMIDGSTLPFDENVALTKSVVDLCKICGAPVEGELGHVGSAASDEMGALTVPEEAEKFARLTGVSFLAVMVGSAHGKYRLPPKLDIGRIEKIHALTGLPLVLHGGSGIPDDQIKLAVKAGIRKINFATDVIQAYYDGFRGKPADDKIWNKALDTFAVDSLANVCRFVEDKMELLGCAGKAD